SRSNRHPPRPTTETTLRLPLIGPTSDNELKTRPCSRRRAIPDGQSAPNRLLQYRALRVALAPAELVGVAQPGRARRREEPSLEAQARFLKRQLSLPVSPTQISHQTEHAPSMRAFSPPLTQFPSLREKGLARAWADGWIEARDQYRNTERAHKTRQHERQSIDA